MASFIYVLKSPRVSETLDELYYVGRTSDIVTRFAKHRDGTGAKVLQGRSVYMISLENETMPFLELVRTLELMQKYGPSKVRGGPFVKFVHSSEDLQMIQKLIESEDFARRPRGSSDTIVLDVAPAPPAPVPTPNTSAMTVDEEDKPARKGRKWDSHEYALLSQLVKQKSPLSEAVEKLKRTPGAIEIKARSLLQDSFNKGQSIDDMAEFLGRQASEIQEVLAGTKSLFA